MGSISDCVDDVAVIDEAQMIQNNERGFAWTRVILGKTAYLSNVLLYFYMLYVIGYWKTDHNVTLGQLHFSGPANSHTHALSMHCCITGLS